MGPPRKVDANDDAQEDLLQYLENICFLFIYFFIAMIQAQSYKVIHSIPVKLTV